jgi:hypothetical protein
MTTEDTSGKSRVLGKISYDLGFQVIGDNKVHGTLSGVTVNSLGACVFYSLKEELGTDPNNLLEDKEGGYRYKWIVKPDVDEQPADTPWRIPTPDFKKN